MTTPRSAADPAAGAVALDEGLGTAPAAASDPPVGRRRVRLLVGGLVLVLGLVVAGLLGIGWYYADEILMVAAPEAQEGDVGVLEVADDTVILARTPRSADPGVWGLAGPDWYAQLEAGVIAEDATTVTRAWTSLPDAPSEGDLATIDGYGYPAEPAGVFGFPIEEVAIPGDLGPMPAFHASGDDDTWVVMVHGRGARRGEAFRMLPTVVERGHPALIVGYRNDPDAPPAPDGRYGLGWTEWEDVDAAVQWAQERGAEDVVLVGFSMGGAIVGNYARQVDDLPIRGMILDAPVVNWDMPLRVAAIDRGVPTFLTPIAQLVVTARTGLRWGALSLLERADELDTPILLFHGDADATVPVEGSDALAAARPDLVTYVRVPDADHVQAWNADPTAYARAVRTFLDTIGA